MTRTAVLPDSPPSRPVPTPASRATGIGYVGTYGFSCLSSGAKDQKANACQPWLDAALGLNRPLVRRKISLVSVIAEIQEAIVQLTPEEQGQLREWLNGLDAERERRWAAVALERLEAIRAGEPTLEADEVFAEARRLAAG
jgi:hypothetical protein